jgi:hypothetical protein
MSEFPRGETGHGMSLFGSIIRILEMRYDQQ